MRRVARLLKSPPPVHTHRSRESIIAEARRQGHDVGDDAMITDGEWGYWVGALVYVGKEKLNRRCG